MWVRLNNRKSEAIHKLFASIYCRGQKMIEIPKKKLHEDISDKIYKLRFSGKTDEAIEFCKEACEKFNDRYSYPKICGDLYLSESKYIDAANYYLEFLRRLKGNRRLFNDFANRYFRLKRLLSKDEVRKYANIILSEIENNNLDGHLAKWCFDLVQSDAEKKIVLSKDGKDLISLLEDDKNFDKMVSIAKKIEDKDSFELAFILDQNVFNRKRSLNRFRVDSHCISIYERLKHYDKSLKIGKELSEIKKESIVIRSIFRICRKIRNYSTADWVIKKYPEILNEYDFNVLYELVYYHELNDDFEMLQSTLNLIEKGGIQSTPIQKTIRNFYLSYGLIDDAQRVEKTIEDLYSGKKEVAEKFSEAIKESEAGVGSKIKELYSDVEHHKSLAAISDLTTGISHELGQPITNIRYTIQFYQRQFQNNVTKTKVFKVFDSILDETLRMGDLVKRLSPLTSSQNVMESFDVMQRIKKRIEPENSKLVRFKISVNLIPERKINIFGDPIHFDQIINNLLLNSIDSIKGRKSKGPKKIEIKVDERDDYIQIFFSDTGTGIKTKNKGKIFDPFFTTKPPGKGEGLGLFIIWNLLKMHGGKIRLDSKYTDGAKFLIDFPKETNYKKEKY